MDSKEATHGLQLLVKHLKLPYRVSSHSARKGAATEAVLAGLPLVAIQAYGLWKEAESLQKYVGEVLRQRFPFLDALWGWRGTKLGRSRSDWDNCPVQGTRVRVSGSVDADTEGRR